jgi:hypothetical protein
VKRSALQWRFINGVAAKIVRIEVEAEALAVLAERARCSSTASSSVSMNAVAPTILSSDEHALREAQG